MTTQTNHKRSIKTRLLWTALPLMLFFLLLTGFALDRAYQRFAIDSEFQKLQLQLWSLMADAEIVDQQLFMPDVLQDALFSQPESGLYGFVFKQGLSQVDRPIWQSISVDALVQGEQLDTQYAMIKQRVKGLEVNDQFSSQRLQAGEFLVFQSVNYYDEKNQAFPLTFVVLESGEKFKQALFQYREVMIIWLVVTLIALLILQSVLLLWGLSPLSKISEDVALIEAGDKALLDEDYPAEVASLTQNLNNLIQSERNQRQRFRHTLSDLAHSLKTPLAVIQSKLEEPELVRLELSQQIDRMNVIVKHQLNRSVRDTKIKTGNQKIIIKTLLDRLISALKQVYKHKPIHVNLNVDPMLGVAIDEGDLMEILGNILDNAFKYTHSKVVVSAQYDESGSQNNTFSICIEDDGDGISDQDRDRVLQRGSRLDQHYEGQGIGLTVAAEIIDAYAGQLLIEQSSLKGAAITLRFSADFT